MVTFVAAALHNPPAAASADEAARAARMAEEVPSATQAPVPGARTRGEAPPPRAGRGGAGLPPPPLRLGALLRWRRPLPVLLPFLGGYMHFSEVWTSVFLHLLLYAKALGTRGTGRASVRYVVSS